MKRKDEVAAKPARKPSGLTAEQRARSSLNLGKTYLRQKKLEIAREYLEQSSSWCRQLDGEGG